MKIIGIIAEYNPFHAGHKHHIDSIRKKYSDSIIICLMSGNVVQRGEFAIFDKWRRTKDAINAGVDVVIQTPPHITLNSANLFAKGSIEILNKFKVEIIIFGSELNNIIELNKVVDIKFSDEYDNKIKELLKDNYSYPKIQEKALGIKLDSNDIMNVNYIYWGRKINKNITFETIKRNNIKFATASEIREKEKLKSKFSGVSMNYFFDIICSDIIKNDGKDNDVINYIQKKLYGGNYANWDVFIESISSKNFTKSRIRREILKLILNIKEEKLLRILGASKTGIGFLGKNKDIRYESKFKSVFENDLVISKIINIKINNYFFKEINEKIYVIDN